MNTQTIISFEKGLELRVDNYYEFLGCLVVVEEEDGQLNKGWLELSGDEHFPFLVHGNFYHKAYVAVPLFRNVDHDQ